MSEKQEGANGEMTPNAGRGRDDDWEILQRITILESEMKEVRVWMVDSKGFHAEARDFFSRSDERAKHRAAKELDEKEERDKLDKKRSSIHFWWLGILSGIIVVAFGVMFTWAVNFENKHKISQDHQTTTTQSQFNAKDQ